MVKIDVLDAQKDSVAREDFIKQNMKFICRCAAKSAKRFVDESDDLFSEALIAFNDAISYYNAAKGAFEPFAAQVIHNRVTNALIKENRQSNVILFSSLASEDDDGDEINFDVAQNSHLDAAAEIHSLKEELKEFDISFYDLPRSSPKAEKTRRDCIQAAQYIASDYGLTRQLRVKKTLPTKDLPFGKKLLERHRKYIIAGVLIISGEYENMMGYFLSESRRCK